jgi:hypothetical protein
MFFDDFIDPRLDVADNRRKKTASALPCSPSPSASARVSTMLSCVNMKTPLNSAGGPVQKLVAFSAKRDQVGLCIVSKGGLYHNNRPCTDDQMASFVVI